MRPARRRTSHPRHQSAHMVSRQHIDRIHALDLEMLTKSPHRRRQRAFIMPRKFRHAARSTRRDRQPPQLRIFRVQRWALRLPRFLPLPQHRRLTQKQHAISLHRHTRRPHERLQLVAFHTASASMRSKSATRINGAAYGPSHRAS